MSDHAPPTNIEAEEAVLGAMLVGTGPLRAALATPLRPDHFYRDKHRAIFAACSRLASQNEPVEPLTVAAAVPREADCDIDYISGLASAVPVAGNADHYARLVIDAAELRSKLTGAQTIQQGVGQRDPLLIQKGIEQVNTFVRHEREPVEPTELADEYITDLYDPTPGVIYGLPWPRLNFLLSGGLQPGDVTALMGWSGMGKTTWLDQTLTQFRKEGLRTLLFDTEMSRKQRINRFVAAKTGIPYAHLVTKKLDEEQRGQIVQTMNELPWALREAEKWTVSEICQEMAVQCADVAAIDTLHAIPYEDEKGLRAITTELKATAKATGTHLVLVCHMNMARAKEAVRPAPVKRDLLGSGAIEQASSNIIAVHRDQDKHGSARDTGKLIALKSRHGLEGECRIRLIAGAYGFEGTAAQSKQEVIDYTASETASSDPVEAAAGYED